MSTNHIKLALLSMAMLACTPVRSGYQLHGTSDVSDAVKFLGQYFTTSSFSAHLECENASVENTMAWNSSLAFPNKASTFNFDFTPTTNLTGQKCYVRIMGTPQASAASKIQWLAQKNGEPATNMLFISENIQVGGSDSDSKLTHKANYYQTFKITVNGGNTGVGGGTIGSGNAGVGNTGTGNTGVGGNTGTDNSVGGNTNNGTAGQSGGNTPLCQQGAATDPDGDGWGWENNQSCMVSGGAAAQAMAKSSGSGTSSRSLALRAVTYPPCSEAATIDPDYSEWGRENNHWCRMSSNELASADH